jgi:hypothetical protein
LLVATDETDDSGLKHSTATTRLTDAVNGLDCGTRSRKRSLSAEDQFWSATAGYLELDNALGELDDHADLPQPLQSGQSALPRREGDHHEDDPAAQQNLRLSRIGRKHLKISRMRCHGIRGRRMVPSSVPHSGWLHAVENTSG